MASTARPTSSTHHPVLYHEILIAINPHSPGRYIDATVGAGGHAWGILDNSSPLGELLGLDLDPQALSIARQNLGVFGKRVHLVQASYTTIPQQMQHLGWSDVDGILLDLGVSSMQLDSSDKGFSFQIQGQLDMRFDPGQQLSADQLVNDLPEDDLAVIIWRYGEDKNARIIARAICRERPIKDTLHLAEVITQAVNAGRRARGPGRKKIHPATLTFQALRIAVNNELESLEATLPQAVNALAPGGRLAIISFHSLEDRIVKQFMRMESRDCICPPGQPICTCGHKATLILKSPRAIKSTQSEIETNPRARSARLRFAEKIQLIT
jgi:16S rRNA (cytosine1402-N4)-methyltransferase